MKFMHFLFIVPVALVGCAAPADEAAEATRPETAEAALTGAIRLDATDDGAHLQARAGQSIILSLPSNPSTGYRWQVVQAAAGFAAPSQRFIGGANIPGAGGTERFTWKVTGAIPNGTYDVELAYVRPWDPTDAAQTFSFTVDVVQNAAALTLTEAASHQIVSVAAGTSVAIELESNASTGYSWKLSSSDPALGAPSETFLPPTSGLIGAPGKQRFLFATSGVTGYHTIRLDYVRPWEVGAPPAQTFLVTLDLH